MSGRLTAWKCPRFHGFTVFRWVEWWRPKRSSCYDHYKPFGRTRARLRRANWVSRVFRAILERYSRMWQISLHWMSRFGANHLQQISEFSRDWIWIPHFMIGFCNLPKATVKSADAPFSSVELLRPCQKYLIGTKRHNPACVGESKIMRHACTYMMYL